MAEKVTTLRRQGDGSLPLNRALDELPADPSIMFHLMPLPVDKSTSTPKHTEPKSTAGSDQGPPNIRKKGQEGQTGQGQGKGKTKASNKGRMPSELIGMHQQTKPGKRMCYNFNLEKGWQPCGCRQECGRGLHQCMRCFGAHSAHQCNSALA